MFHLTGDSLFIVCLYFHTLLCDYGQVPMLSSAIAQGCTHYRVSGPRADCMDEEVICF